VGDLKLLPKQLHFKAGCPSAAMSAGKRGKSEGERSFYVGGGWARPREGRLSLLRHKKGSAHLFHFINTTREKKREFFKVLSKSKSICFSGSPESSVFFVL